MVLRRLARKALWAFVDWRHRRRVARAAPRIAELERLLAERKRQHRPTEPTRRQLRALVTARLAREQGITLPERITP